MRIVEFSLSKQQLLGLVENWLFKNYGKQEKLEIESYDDQLEEINFRVEDK